MTVSPALTLTVAVMMLLLCLWVKFVVIKDNARALGQIVVGGTHAFGKLMAFALILGAFVLGLYLLLVLIKFLWRLA